MTIIGFTVIYQPWRFLHHYLKATKFFTAKVFYHTVYPKHRKSMDPKIHAF